MQYLPTIGTNTKQKTALFGDQGFYERGKLSSLIKQYLYALFKGMAVSFSRSSEEDMCERLDGLISIP